MRIIWVTPTLNHNVASFRYRALYPSFFLEDAGVENTFAELSDVDAAMLRKFDVVIFVKTPGSKVTKLITDLYGPQGPRLYLDLCDFVTHPIYGNGTGLVRRAEIFAQLPYIEGIVVPTEQLKEALAGTLNDYRDIYVIPDQCETPETLDRTEKFATSKPWSVKLRQFPKVGFRLIRKVVQRSLYVAPIRMKSMSDAAGSASRHYFQMIYRDPKLALRSVRSRLMTSRPKAAAPATEGNRAPVRLVWFGNSGSTGFQSGIQTLALIAPDLVHLSERTNFELLVISNDRSLFDQFVKPLPIVSRFQYWNQQGCMKAVSSADAVLMPQIEDAFSACKSANRALLALACGTPVIASELKSLDPLRDCIVIDDWQEGFRRYLEDPEATARDLKKAKSIIDRQFSKEAVGNLWLERLRAPRREVVAAPRVIVFVQLVQDVAVLWPVIKSLVAAGHYDVQVALDASVYVQHPGVVRELLTTGANLSMLREQPLSQKVDAIGLSEYAALIVGAETSLRPHSLVHAVVKKANAMGLPTITIQHGLECPGLSYFDHVHTTSVSIASQHIFSFGHPDLLPDGASESVRARCIPVGRIAPHPGPALERLHRRLAEENRSGLPVVSVFENLHWHRYEREDYRARFSDHFNRLTLEFPDIFFAIKPHPAGMWLQKNARILEARGNCILFRRDDPDLSDLSAADLLSVSAGAIVTPSTVALDAVQLRVPVLLFANTLQLDMFGPLKVARSYDEFRSFSDAVRNGQASSKSEEAFLAERLASGDPERNLRNALDRIVGRADESVAGRAPSVPDAARPILA